ncbi:hypothetical protein [Alcaligenes faecalis]|nr:hypothetical protein [Alcaligenes faecalis]MDV2114889.1 hypothetical protein [Alcaligenes faecalis]
MTLNDIKLDFSDMSLKALLENKFINVISQISSKNYLAGINPVIYEVAKITWDQEIVENVDDYFCNMTNEKKKILRLMEYREQDGNSKIEFDIKSTISPYYSCIRKEAKNEKEFWLCFRSRYLNEFAKRTGKEYQEESWIDKSRIHFL